jgi:putative DNA primase/helicase
VNDAERDLSKWITDGPTATPAGGNGTGPMPADDAELPLTDRGQAQRFAREYAGRVRYCPQENTYLVWNGRQFQRDAHGVLTMPLAKATARRQLNATMAAVAIDRQRLRAALYAESATGLSNTLKLAKSEPGIPVQLAELDAEPLALNTQNGIVNTTTGAILAHDPARLCTRITSTIYDPVATCPRWLGLLARIFAGRVELIDYVQRALGMAITGKSERVVLVMHGEGGNGKSTLVKIVRGVIGDDYTATTPADTVLVKRRDAAMSNDLARLAGRRLVHVAELEGRRLSEGLVKQLTGGDAVASRFLHQEFFEYVPTFTLLLTCNRPPRITGTDRAIWDRVHLIPFDVVIPPAEQDRDLAERLIVEEGPGILAWLVQGAIAWHKAGRLVPAKAVVAATRRYRDEQDVLAPFLGERCTVAEDARVSVADLYTTYTGWARDSGETAMSKAELRRALMARGFAEPVRGTGGTRTWQGIRPRHAADPEALDLPATAEDVTLWN